jgi:hypothetical protein
MCSSSVTTGLRMTVLTGSSSRLNLLTGSCTCRTNHQNTGSMQRYTYSGRTMHIVSSMHHEHWGTRALPAYSTSSAASNCSWATHIRKTSHKPSSPGMERT